jgi:tetratricopeptide (TPR) repeat protein
MSDEVSQSGAGNVAVYGNTNSTVNVTQLMGRSADYQDLQTRLTELQDRLKEMRPEMAESRAKVLALIADQKNLIKKFEQGVIQLGETLSRVNIKNTARLGKANELFEKGEFGEARRMLEAELSQMTEEHEDLLEKKLKYESEILPLLKHNADEFMVLALATTLNVDDGERYDRACEFYERSLDAEPSSRNLFSYALFLHTQNELQPALRFYKRVRNEFFDEFTPEGQAGLLNNIGNVEVQLLRYKDAVDHLSEAAEMYDALNEIDDSQILEYIRVLFNLGNAQRNAKNYDEAERLTLKAMQIMVERKDADFKGERTFQIGFGFYGLALIETDRKNYDKAEEHFQKCLEIRRKLAKGQADRRSDLGAALYSLGYCRSKAKNYASAIESFNEALTIFRSLAEKEARTYEPSLSFVLNSLGITLKEDGQLRAAAANLKEAIDLRLILANRDPLPNQALLAESLQERGDVFVLEERVESGEVMYLESLSFWRRAYEKDPEPYRTYLVDILLKLAVFYRDTKPDAEKLDEYTGEAQQLFAKMANADPELKEKMEAVIAARGTGKEIEQKAGS